MPEVDGPAAGVRHRAGALNAFAVGDRNQDGRPDLVVSVYDAKDWKRKKGGGWSGDSKLWLYRRRA